MRRALGLMSLVLVAFSATYLIAARQHRPAALATAKDKDAVGPSAEALPGMVWIPGGEFVMGSDDRDAPHTERPAHPVRVDGFWIDATEVTNAEFRRFVEATGYKTTAERPVDWEQLKSQLPPGTPKPPEEQLKPGSLVFSPPKGAVPLGDASRWWAWVQGADWRHPEGPDSTIDGKDDHPVVSVSWDDAAAYASWAGKRLPTEAEWEYAARGGLERKTFAWGDEFRPGGRLLANTWQGRFPDRNTGEDGHPRTAPVKSFPPNAFGLYDMVGNAWEWCSDWYRPDGYARDAGRGVVVNPEGPDASFDPDEPFQPKRVTRGGSFLCAENYCSSYRPAARRGTATDSGMSHLGFRCVRAADSP